MNENLNYSENGFEVTKHFEGCKLTAYWDELGKVWTIGYGHTGHDIHDGMCINELAADQYLRQDIKEAENAVRLFTKINLTQGQFDCLVDFTFNEGSLRLKYSTLISLINQEKFNEVPKELGKWIFAGGKVNNWQKLRRNADIQLWLGQEVTLD